MYWDQASCDQLPPLIAQQVFDFAVNSGPNRAVRYLQLTVGAKTDGIFGPKTAAAVQDHIDKNSEQQLAQTYVQHRKEFITKSTKINEKFKKGLLNRIDTLERIITDNAKSMPIKPNSPTMRAKNPPQPVIRPFDSKQIEVFADAKPMPLDPNAYLYEPKPHRLTQHLEAVPSPWAALHGVEKMIPQRQNPEEIAQLYTGVHATQDINLAAIYANNRGSADDPPVVIEFATSQQWEPDVDVTSPNFNIDHIHEKVMEIPGLAERVKEFEQTGNVDWEYIQDVFDEVESDDEWPDLYNEGTDDINEQIMQSAQRGTLASLAEFFKTYYAEDENQQAFDFHVPRYLQGFYEWYLLPLFSDGTMDARIDAWFLNQMRFMEPIEENEIVAIYKVRRYNPEIWDPETREDNHKETDDEGRDLISQDDFGYWQPSLKIIWESPDAVILRKHHTYYHGTSLSRARQALAGIVDAMTATSDLVTKYGQHWGEIAATLRQTDTPPEIIAIVNKCFHKVPTHKGRGILGRFFKSSTIDSDR
jgi:hypothetical protein